ncbi:MAG: branched-chain amino acid ABC transporter permease [Clostridiales bacterium]|nr:branched-chain amino acid ABC transporter permease [Clostridiales bacterium]
MKRKAFKAALPYTLPVFLGYLFLGVAFGVLLTTQGFPAWLAVVMSLAIYAGSGQFVAIGLLTAPFHPLNAVAVTLAVNARHLFYGLSILDKVKEMGKRRWYVAFALTDETYSLLCSVEPPPETDKNWFLFFISLLNHGYWIFGSALGAVAGSVLRFDATGIEFAMTALFIVIFVEQWESAKSRIPALLGLAVTALCLWLAGPDRFIICAMIGIFLSLTALRGRLEASVTAAGKKEAAQ